MFCQVCRTPIAQPKRLTCSIDCLRILRAKNLLSNPKMNFNGRLSGTRNKNPYPRSEAVIRRYQDNPPPSWIGKHHKPETTTKMSITRTQKIAKGEIQLSSFYNGRFRPKHPEKYKGDPSNIIWRSKWELKYFMKLDADSDVLEWSSEEIRIGYLSPLDNRPHTYFPDVYVKKRNPATDKVEQYILEIKPLYQLTMPVKEGKSDKRFLKEAKTFAVNEAKFKAAQSYCEKRGWTFQVLTEKELNIPAREYYK